MSHVKRRAHDAVPEAATVPHMANGPSHGQLYFQKDETRRDAEVTLNAAANGGEPSRWNKATPLPRYGFLSLTTGRRCLLVTSSSSSD